MRENKGRGTAAISQALFLRRLRLPAAPVLMFCCVMALLMLCCTAGPVFAEDSCPAGGEHDYEVRIEKRATQTRDGLRRYTCRKCGNTYTEKIPAMGHVWGPWKTEKKATCTEAGRQTRVCRKHKGLVHTQSRVVPALGHDWGAWTKVRPASAGRPGLEKRVCRNNAKEIQYRQIPAFGVSDGGNGPGKTTGGLMISRNNQEGQDSSGSASGGSNAGTDEGTDSGSASGSGAGTSGSGTGGDGDSGRSQDSSGTQKATPFGAVDAAILGADGAALLFWVILLLPLIRVMFWAAAKRREKEEEETA